MSNPDDGDCSTCGAPTGVPCLPSCSSNNEPPDPEPREPYGYDMGEHLRELQNQARKLK